MQQLLSVVLLRHLRPITAMLRHAILQCPDEAFAATGQILVREHLYHAMTGMDVWLSPAPDQYPVDTILENTAAQLQGSASENISRPFLLAFVGKLEARIEALPTDAEGLLEKRSFQGHELTFMDQCFSQIRHVQHHLGAIDEILRNQNEPVLEWSGYAG